MLRKFCSIVSALVLLTLVGWADYVTGYEISLIPCYALAIAWVTWRLGLGWGIFFSFLSRGIWLYVDLAGGEHYHHLWHAWEKAGAGLIMMLFVSISFHIFKQTLQRERARLKQLEGVLPVCSSCKRIQDSNGYWMELAAFLREYTATKPQSKFCPDCARSRYVAGHSEIS